MRIWHPRAAPERGNACGRIAPSQPGPLWGREPWSPAGGRARAGAQQFLESRPRAAPNPHAPRKVRRAPRRSPGPRRRPDPDGQFQRALRLGSGRFPGLVRRAPAHVLRPAEPRRPQDADAAGPRAPGRTRSRRPGRRVRSRRRRLTGSRQTRGRCARLGGRARVSRRRPSVRGESAPEQRRRRPRGTAGRAGGAAARGRSRSGGSPRGPRRPLAAGARGPRVSGESEGNAAKPPLLLPPRPLASRAPPAPAAASQPPPPAPSPGAPRGGRRLCPPGSSTSAAARAPVAAVCGLGPSGRPRPPASPGGSPCPTLPPAFMSIQQLMTPRPTGLLEDSTPPAGLRCPLSCVPTGDPQLPGNSASFPSLRTAQGRQHLPSRDSPLSAGHKILNCEVFHFR